MDLCQGETFKKPSLFVISTEGRNLNGLELLRFLVAHAPRNDKIEAPRRKHFSKVSLHLRKLEAFQVGFFENFPCFVLMLFYCLLKSVPVGVFVVFTVFLCVVVGQRVVVIPKRVPAGEWVKKGHYVASLVM